jgi:WD40 repeat protein
MPSRSAPTAMCSLLQVTTRPFAFGTQQLEGFCALYGHNSRVLSVAFSPDGKLLASGGAAQVDLGPRTRTGQLILWNPLTGEEEYVFQTTFGDVRSLTFSPDNRVLANSDGFGDFTVVTSWEVSTRTLRSKWTAHRGNINTLTYSPDGQWLASGGDDGRIRLWQ